MNNYKSLLCFDLSNQVALERTKPNGRVVGIDIIPAQPPRGVSTIQGNFLSPSVQQLVKDYLVEFAQRKSPSAPAVESSEEDGKGVITERQSYIDAERAESVESEENLEGDGRLVDVCNARPIRERILMPRKFQEADRVIDSLERHVSPLDANHWIFQQHFE
jgi:23S rRNA U2552 (ribose-2'-O)-methylase RlmE/FtsJ